MTAIALLLLLVLGLPVVSAVAAAFRFERIAASEGGEPAWPEALQPGLSHLTHNGGRRGIVARHAAPSPAPTRGAAR